MSDGLSDEETCLNVWTTKENLNHQLLLNLISDRARLL